MCAVFVLGRGFRVLSGDEDGQLQLWQAEDGTPLLVLDAGATSGAAAGVLEVTPNTQLAVSGGADDTV